MQATQGKNGAKERTVDLLRLVKILWKRAWVIILVMIVVAAVVFVGTKLFMTPMYSSSFTAYVNNRQSTVEGQVSTSSGDISASRYLTFLYEEIIVSRSVLMGAAEACDLNYSYGQMKSMVKTSVATTAAIITVTVESADPQEAQMLATAVSVAAVQNVERIVEGSSMQLVDAPVLPTQPFSPNSVRNAMFGAVIALVVCVVLVVLRDLIVDKIDNPQEMEERHGLVVIGTIPDMMQAYSVETNHSRRR